MKKATVFVTGSLSTPKKWWNFYGKIAGTAKRLGYKVKTSKEMIKHDNPGAIYKEFLKIMKDSDLIIAEVTNRSTGTGVEVGYALKLKKRIICMAHKDASVTKIILSPAQLGLIKTIRYSTEKEALKKLETALTRGW